MKEIIGKYSRAVVYTDNIESEATAQIFDLLNTKMTENQSVRIMPDTHSGKGCVIGYTQTCSGGPLDPDVVGVDISCLDCDTEVLTPKGWIKISNYSGEKIMHFNPETDYGEFLYPIKFIKSPCKELHRYWKRKLRVELQCSSWCWKINVQKKRPKRILQWRILSFLWDKFILLLFAQLVLMNLPLHTKIQMR